MIILKASLILLFVLGFNSPFAQNKYIAQGRGIYKGFDASNLKPLKVGDKVPDILFSEMINYDRREARLSEFKGKIVILDFWSTSCAVCIGQFPHIQNLQKEVADKAIIIPVGFDAQEEGSIRRFIERRRGTKFELRLPTSIQSSSDKILEKLFPFASLPHEVWINSEGILVGLTDHRAVSARNIERVYKGEFLVDVSKSLVKYFRKKESFLISKDSATGGYTKWGSVFSGFQKNWLNGWPFGKQYDSNFIRLFDVNQTVIEFYAGAYKHRNEWLDKKLIKVRGKARKFQDWDYSVGLDDLEYEAFCKRNTYNYELILPKANFTLEDAYNYLIQDFDRYFGIKSSIKTEENTYLALIRTSAVDRIKSKGIGESKVTTDKYLNSYLHISAEPINALISQLNGSANTSYIIRDETDYKGMIDIIVPYGNRIDLDYVRQILLKYDLALVERVKREPLLILE